jgi:site-specific recombinase XerD
MAARRFGSGFPYPTTALDRHSGSSARVAAKGHDTRALQAYLGHKNIQHTVRYTELSSTRTRVSVSLITWTGGA